MKKAYLGLFLGLIAGVIDIIPMLIQKLSWDANLSALSLWLVSGFLVSTSSLKLKGAVKGILVSFLALLPSAVIIGWKEPASLMPIAAMTIVLGALLGYCTERFGK